MSAKIKYSPRKGKPNRDAFDMTGSLFAFDDEDMPARGLGEARPDLEHDIHPSISDFVVRTARKAASVKTDAGSDLEMDLSTLQSRESLTFISFGSGSSGNCSYLGTGDKGILIDAGIDPDTVRDGLRSHGIDPRSICGIILTHDHTDHVKYVYSHVRKRFDIAVYCTPKVLSGLLRRHSISRRIKEYHKPVYKEFAFTVGGMEITPFDVSHDGTDNVGYFITYAGINVAVATDLGSVTPRVDYYMRQANHIVIESNYDLQMLLNGPYPQHLKARIQAATGHLDNTAAAAYIASIVSPRLRTVLLCHLSHENNMPELAVGAMRTALAGAGFTEVGDGSGSLDTRDMPLQLAALPRLTPSPLYTLGKII